MTAFEDSKFTFVYDVKNTAPGEFPDPGHFDVKGFRPDTKVTVEMQVHSRKFKPRGGDKGGQGNLGYSFKPIGIYKLQDVKILPPSTPEKRRKEANEWIATPPRTKKTCAALNPLEWAVDQDVASKTISPA